jgi:hypothetical protein
MMIDLTTAFVATIVFLGLYFIKNWSGRQLPPGPWGLPIVGSIPFLGKTVVFSIVMPHCIRCSHFKVDDVSALEAIVQSRFVEDSVTAFVTYGHNMDLLVPAGTSTRLD